MSLDSSSTPPPPSTAGPPAPMGGDSGDLKPLISYSLLSGLCSLIPVPFVDDWARDIFRRRLVRGLLADTPAHMDSQRVQVLACGYNPVTAQGCVKGCAWRVVRFPFDFVVKFLINKLLRKIIFVLAIKDCVDNFSATFHEGFLVRHALKRHEVCDLCSAPAPHGDHHHDAGRSFQTTVDLRRQVEEVRDEVDHRPVERWVRKTFRGSRTLLKESARILRRQVRRLKKQGDVDDARLDQDVRAQMSAQESHGFDTLVSELTEEIGSESGYLRDLERRLDARLNQLLNPQSGSETS